MPSELAVKLTFTAPTESGLAGPLWTLQDDHVPGLFDRAVSVAPPGSGARWDPNPPQAGIPVNIAYSPTTQLIARSTLRWDAGGAEVADAVLAELRAQAELSAVEVGLPRSAVAVTPAGASATSLVSLRAKAAGFVAEHPVKVGIAAGAAATALLLAWFARRAA
jgi:hypothetical protein